MSEIKSTIKFCAPFKQPRLQNQPLSEFSRGKHQDSWLSGRRVRCHLEHRTPNPTRQSMMSLLEPSMMSSSTTCGLVMSFSFKGLHTARSSSSDLQHPDVNFLQHDIAY